MPEPNRHADCEIVHLFERPQWLHISAAMIHAEFWVGVKGGFSEADLRRHLGTAVDADRVPLSLVAVAGGQWAGTINLIENDDASLPQLHPWLAALVVAQPWRGRGIGSALVRRLCAEARRIGFTELYFGTDGPGFYERLGALRHLERKAGFWIMRIALAPP